jgi:hypothetical protein
MIEPQFSYRRIDQLKARAFECGFTNEDAKQFGKLSKTSTWEALLESYGIFSQLVDSVDSVDRVLDTELDSLDQMLDIAGSPTQSPDTSESVNCCSSPARSFSRQNSSFLDWVDLSQLIALALASAGVFVLAMSLWPRINPLNLFPPIRINIQIGATK